LLHEKRPQELGRRLRYNHQLITPKGFKGGIVLLRKNREKKSRGTFMMSFAKKSLRG